MMTYPDIDHRKLVVQQFIVSQFITIINDFIVVKLSSRQNLHLQIILIFYRFIIKQFFIFYNYYTFIFPYASIIFFIFKKSNVHFSNLTYF